MKLEGQDIIIHLAKLNPKKRGSFEDYIGVLAQELKRQNKRFIVIFTDPVAKEFKDLYQDIEVLILSEEVEGFFGFYYKLWQIVKRYKPRIIHLSFYPIFEFLTIFLYFSGVKNIVFTDHSSGVLTKHKGFKKILVFFKNKLTSLFIRKIICVSNYVFQRDQCILGVDKTKFICLLNGIDLSRFRPQENKRILRNNLFPDLLDRFILLSYASFIKAKGLDYLINALALLINKYPNMFLLLAWEGPQEAELKALVSQLNLDKQVRFLGVRNDTEKLLALSDVFIFPSTWQEACGLSLMESLAVGIPTIATKVGAIPELIEDKETGLLIEAKDAQAIASEIEYFYNNQEFRETITKKAIVRAKKLFDLDRLVKETVAVYNNYL